MDGKVKTQREISDLIGCKPAYVSQVKNKDYKHLFESDGTPNSKGCEFLGKHRDKLNSFYDEKGI